MHHGYGETAGGSAAAANIKGSIREQERAVEIAVFSGDKRDAIYEDVICSVERYIR